MAEKMGAFPFWEVDFDERGRKVGSGAATLVAELPGQRLTDLFICSHGWNNSRAVARKLYAKFFGQMTKVLCDPKVQPRGRYKIGTVGIVWPAMRWADEDTNGPGGGSAAFASTAKREKTIPSRNLVEALKAVYRSKEQRQAIKELADLIEARSDDETALDRFQDLLHPLVCDPDAKVAPEDNALESTLLDYPSRVVFRAFADASLSQGDCRKDLFEAATMHDSLQRAWDGALDGLRTATYWQMKRRAGVVGVSGLGPLLGEIRGRNRGFAFT